MRHRGVLLRLAYCTLNILRTTPIHLKNSRIGCVHQTYYWYLMAKNKGVYDCCRFSVQSMQ